MCFLVGIYLYTNVPIYQVMQHLEFIDFLCYPRIVNNLFPVCCHSFNSLSTGARIVTF